MAQASLTQISQLKGSDGLKTNTTANSDLHWVACPLERVYRCDAVGRWAGGLARHFPACVDHFVSGDTAYLGFAESAEALDALGELEDLGIYPEASAFQVYSTDELPARR